MVPFTLIVTLAIEALVEFLALTVLFGRVAPDYLILDGTLVN